MPQKNSLLPLCMALLILAPAASYAQAKQYPPVAGLMARDGFTRRQNGHIAKINKESMEANRLGFLAYQKKDYAKAIGHFNEAIAIDQTNMFAHFNLACSLSLANGGNGDPETLRLIRSHLAAAAALDEHWIYKAFLDTDLNAVRDRLIDFTIYFPCPGDCCPDQTYYLHTDGRAEYATAYPDLSGLGNAPKPDIEATGWYMIIGDRFLIYITGRNAVLAQYPSNASSPADGGEVKDMLLIIPFTKNAAGKIESVDRAF